MLPQLKNKKIEKGEKGKQCNRKMDKGYCIRLYRLVIWQYLSKLQTY